MAVPIVIPHPKVASAGVNNTTSINNIAGTAGTISTHIGINGPAYTTPRIVLPLDSQVVIGDVEITAQEIANLIKLMRLQFPETSY